MRYNPGSMPLSSGTRLGPYEILNPLGAGGMGEVYRARDTRLGRDVAIKILPPHLSESTEARQRFEREARSLSSLNHPHICALYDIGSQDGTKYLVMEYLEGETLAQRLEKGPLPLEQFLRTAIEIADARDRARRHAGVHGDVKPGNVMLPKAAPSLRDWGWARAGPPALQDLSALPPHRQPLGTDAGSRPITAEGMIVGTVQYMAPEQLEGHEADARSDIFSFGAVLYEMATTRKAFEGRSAASVIAAILEKDPPPISQLQPLFPPALERLVKTCLAKDPDERWQTVHDVLLELKWVAEAGSQAGVPAPVVSHRKLRERLAWAAAGVMTLIAIAFAIGFVLPAPKLPQPVRPSAEIGGGANLFIGLGPSAGLSPDGPRLAFVGQGADQKRRIYVRPLDQLQAGALSGTENARNPFFSPDSQWIAFFADRMLKKISVQGGAPVTLCDAPEDRGGSWSEDGTIVFAPDRRVGLSKVSSAGRTPETLTTPDKQAGEVTHRWPQVLPGGKAVLFTSSTNGDNYEDSDLVVYSTPSGKRKTVHRGGFQARYLPIGHLVYLHKGTLFAVPFDLKRLEVTGQAAPILEGVVNAPAYGGAQFSFSETGNLVYVAGHSVQNVSLYWMDREGKFQPLRETPGDYYNPALSPDR